MCPSVEHVNFSKDPEQLLSEKNISKLFQELMILCDEGTQLKRYYGTVLAISNLSFLYDENRYPDHHPLLYHQN